MPTTRQREIQNSMFRTPVHCFFPDVLRAKNIVRVIESKLYRNDLRGNKNYFELAVACENIRFSSLFAPGDVSRETFPAAKSEEKRMFSQAKLAGGSS